MKPSHSRYKKYLEAQQKFNENEEKFRLEKEREVILKKRERGERKFANKNKQGYKVYKRMHPSVRKYSKRCK